MGSSIEVIRARKWFWLAVCATGLCAAVSDIGHVAASSIRPFAAVSVGIPALMVLARLVRTAAAGKAAWFVLSPLIGIAAAIALFL